MKEAGDAVAARLLHARQEKLRRRRLGEAYAPISFSEIGPLIEQKLKTFSLEQCMRVVRADAAEVKRGGNARFFGTATWSEKNFRIKLAKDAEDRPAMVKRYDPIRFDPDKYEKHLAGLAESLQLSERKVLLTRYWAFHRRFHRKKKTWGEVRKHYAYNGWLVPRSLGER